MSEKILYKVSSITGSLKYIASDNLKSLVKECPEAHTIDRIGYVHVIESNPNNQQPSTNN